MEKWKSYHAANKTEMTFMEDKKYYVELEVVTPLSVGAGNDNDWMRGIDYVQKDGKVYVLDIKKVAEQGIDIDRLTTLFKNTDEQGISMLIGNKLEAVSRFVFKSPVSTTNAIKTFLRTQLFNKPVVAGSSIKGSVRSALFNYLRDNERTNEEVFGNMKDGTDFMRFIRIADIEMPSTRLINTKLFNLQKKDNDWTGGWKHAMTETTSQFRANGFNTLYECEAPGNKGIGTISLAGNLFEVLASNTDKSITKKDKKRTLLREDIHTLFKIINQVTREYLLKEKTFFEKYTAERSSELLDNVNMLLNIIPCDNSFCLLKMSAGVGFHSITGDWQYDDYSKTGLWEDGRNAGKKKYKSRKTAEYGGHLQLMGFVKLRALNADDVAKEMDSLTEEHAEIIESIIAPARQREIEMQKRLEEDNLRQKAIEEEREKQSLFRELLNQAQGSFNDNLWDDAISKIEEANSIYPDHDEVISLKNKIKKAKEVEEFRSAEQAATTQKFSQPLAEVIMGKTSAGNLIGTLAKWLKQEGHTFGETEYAAFLQEAKKLSPKEIKNMRGKRKDLQKAIGDNQTERLLKDLGLI